MKLESVIRKFASSRIEPFDGFTDVSQVQKMNTMYI